jgi:hypothetical protein
VTDGSHDRCTRVSILTTPNYPFHPSTTRFSCDSLILFDAVCDLLQKPAIGVSWLQVTIFRCVRLDLETRLRNRRLQVRALLGVPQKSLPRKDFCVSWEMRCLRTRLPFTGFHRICSTCCEQHMARRPHGARRLPLNPNAALTNGFRRTVKLQMPTGIPSTQHTERGSTAATLPTTAGA